MLIRPCTNIFNHTLLEIFQVDPAVTMLTRSHQNEKGPHNLHASTTTTPFSRHFTTPQIRARINLRSQTKPKMCPVQVKITPCSIENSWRNCIKRGPGKIVKSTSVADERVIRFEPQNRPFFQFSPTLAHLTRELSPKSVY